MHWTYASEARRVEKNEKNISCVRDGDSFARTSIHQLPFFLLLLANLWHISSIHNTHTWSSPTILMQSIHKRRLQHLQIWFSIAIFFCCARWRRLSNKSIHIDVLYAHTWLPPLRYFSAVQAFSLCYTFSPFTIAISVEQCVVSLGIHFIVLLRFTFSALPNGFRQQQLPQPLPADRIVVSLCML